MSSRQAVPAELKRRVLVEAGHRCAIHTCRYPVVDIHHIIPWEQCKEHSYDNLIALCPNCHRRADAGEVDRKALRMYKARLAAALSIPKTEDRLAEGRGGSTKSGAWSADKVGDVNRQFPLFEAELEYPVFAANSGEFAELNAILHGTALEQLHGFRAPLLLLERSDVADRVAGATSSLAGSFEVSLFNDHLLSIRFSNYGYRAGAAHGWHLTNIVNYQRDPFIPLTLDAIFHHLKVPPALQFISQYCISQISLENGNEGASDWLKRGASPETRNFTKFNFIARGLLITFDEYQVGPYAEGGRQVTIPWYRLRGFLNPSCKVALWLGHT